jgi:cephalosporin-C deacetylase-like acetyl esterase
MLGRHLKGLAEEAFQRRARAYEQATTAEQLAAYQERLRKFFLDQIGPLPERTPLNAQAVGRLPGDGYRIEKLIYESQPRHYVTANLYLPEAKPPYPAVLVPCGHSANGKASNQRVCILLAKHGIAAMCYDPIGQGERYQFLDREGKPRFKPTTEHTLVGASSIPLGRNAATYRIWDGIRSLDYLASRKDIDGTKLGVTGCSGGGTMTSYLMALDDRVACAAPSCYVTSWRRLLETIGPQDAEQNIFGQIAGGMDHADYLLMHSPKPTLILASTRDFFDIQGTWDSFRQAKRWYTRQGYAERIELVETDEKHGYPKAQREAMLRWMRRWLQGVDMPVTEPDFDTHTAAELQCTPSGQVMLLPEARSVADLNAELAGRLAAERREMWQPSNRQRALDEVRRIAGVRKLSELPRPKVEKVGSIEREGYRIDKVVLHPEAGIRLPGLLFEPAKPSGKRTLYLHGEGKHADAAEGGPLAKLAAAGEIVLAIDLRGTGEIGTRPDALWGANWNDFFLSYLLGKSLVGMRAEDVLTAARYLTELDDRRTESKLRLVAIGVAGPPALHAAALESQLFGALELRGSPQSWTKGLADPTVGGQLGSTVHGALRAYDLPDLVASLSTIKVERD